MIIEDGFGDYVELCVHYLQESIAHKLGSKVANYGATLPVRVIVFVVADQFIGLEAEPVAHT